jgi:hypothetical protein
MPFVNENPVGEDAGNKHGQHIQEEHTPIREGIPAEIPMQYFIDGLLHENSYLYEKLCKCTQK